MRRTVFIFLRVAGRGFDVRFDIEPQQRARLAFDPGLPRFAGRSSGAVSHRGVVHAGRRSAACAVPARPFGMHRIEGERTQCDGPPVFRFAQIEQDIEPLSGRDVGLLDMFRRREQPAVGADQVVAQPAAVLQESEPVRARVRAIEDAETIDAARGLNHRLLSEIHEQPRADKASEEIIARRRVAQPALRVEIAILQHERNLGRAEREIERAAQPCFVLVLDEEQACQSVIRLPRDEAVRMWVVPVHRGPVLHLELVLEGLAGLGEHESAAVVAPVVAEPMPVNDRRLIERVDHAHAHFVAAAREQRRIEKRLAPDSTT
ncbi:MAG TPA: hypothetical protein VFR86_30225 [Burkholderiaceae bacterium]|nr:hypothetical protein [Burkholderiaceae bacterium]